jgi:serine/threonine protein kinase
MSPEQAEGKLKVDGRTDLYSLGVIMFECLTGKLPFKSNNHLATLHQILTEPPSRVTTQNPKVPEWLSEIVAACLIKDRSERISDCTVLLDALQNKKLPFKYVESFSAGQTEETEKMTGRNKTPSTTNKPHIPRQTVYPYMDKRPLWIVIFLFLFMIIVFLSILILKP